VGASAEALLLHGALENAFGVAGELAEEADLLGGHLGVGVDGLGGTATGGASTALVAKDAVESRVLELSGGEDTGANLC